MTNPRQIALIALGDIHAGAYADVALNRVLQKVCLPDLDRRLLTELVYGTVRRQRTLDALINQLATKKSHQQPKNLRIILHLGLYQLRYQERIPASAAVNTTVELAKENGFAGLTGFVNGLLRQYIRLAEKSPEPLKLPENPVERLGVLHSFPDWVIQVWLEQLSLAETEQLCQWMNQTPTIDLRINPLRTTIEKVEEALHWAGILTRRVPHLPQALRLIGSTGAIQNLPGFGQGWWSVQDASAQLVGYLLNPQPGEVVIDACAAPGGKTTHIAELMQDQGEIWAGDRTASRLRKLKENAQRLHLQSIRICTGDSRYLPQFYNTSDRVLLDAPCSGLGTLHRHADARWRQTPESVQELQVLQTELISHTSKFVKSGGVLVYATCTLHPDENEGVISRFLANHPRWEIEPPRVDAPEFAYSTPQGWLKVWPHEHNMDGFFMVRLRKTNDSE
ncbi:16S rRNA (cytosine(967)-C(5))-methyltransferase [Umezakia ovalisporum]|jgi:16S rRNA (cytosine967-C5)-methyltransferase|uniref:16S rRNA (cytosine(967)-C(5))-methyltransferase n=2 Tax=Umezakia ovalisporum TaxID=75695 RepID=A0AA43H0U7_9CYAN|nr:16S rRNA (cytosine(967)-C(5))-methyltransferase [Umezakia ovalisporum]MBI1241177.1 16S rRNA (cytosine(967)-C(5))-methyltransferase [Nostoc sp. RI_552]MDH6057755.1 16S rRNA (cytosine(967)-C(5))-methyltransferase [Umezakia ovalisporum FSS-43]MDH6064787.1 16S rRNA (cytosine(967)-C(5))-methyltransferase [Umezakia ovalisporum FSS-62]MDH6067387.1 16S rRNA (cytosine(967)-C(5))-methyltransferase [Umezakia ovalisporum APH033B]MDH6070342.1 16S rRNA (cytosine(967)-C(5))-methyltransferase [Umezakia ova